METTRLIERCCAGDAQAVEALVQMYQQPVFRLAVSILDDPQEADEAAQDALIAAVRSIHTYRGDSQFTTWLFRIVINECRMRLRKNRARLRLAETLQSVFRLARPDLVKPEEAVIQRESESAMWSALRALDEKHRLPVLLHYYHEVPTAEIARILEISPGTVHSRLHYARQRLHAALSDLPVVEDAYSG